MKVSVVGLGYVGTVSAGCLSSDGHQVVGVDPNETKVDLINQGVSPIVEPGVDVLVRAQVQSGGLRATKDIASAILETELSLICVGTPSRPNGSLDLSSVLRVCEEIGEALRGKHEFHVVVVRSTMLPGTTRNLLLPVLEQASGKVAGRDFGLCTNPEFLREGNALADYRNPPRTVIGESDARSGNIVALLYAHLEAPLVRTNTDTAEMVKYADNAWHALKVSFANEIGTFCERVGIDSHDLMEIFCLDETLNLSRSYLRPGFAFGGSCLPKDVRALAYEARALDLELPLVNAILPSNAKQLERGLELIMSTGRTRIGVLGLSYKAGTDDLRESPLVEVVERLLGKGCDLRLYDANVELALLTGANRDYILNRIPHISRLLVSSIEEVLEHAETVVIGTREPEFVDILSRLTPDQAAVDFTRVATRTAGLKDVAGVAR